MASPLVTLIGQLRRAAAIQGGLSLTDAQLLERWLERRDEAAFELLLLRHGPLVLGTCRRLLRQTQEVEDAFQATFLVLVRKASTVRNRASLANWLYTVAYRVACRLRSAAAHREETALVDEIPAPDRDEVLGRELREILDDGISRLPDKYRSAFILCHLQGKTNAQAAAELGCPVGTVLSRLATARARLRSYLTRRGVTSAVGCAALVAAPAAQATLPSALVIATLRVATSWSTGAALAGSSGAVSLAKGMLQTMAALRLKLTALTFLGVSLLGTTSVVGYRMKAEEPVQKPLDVPVAFAAHAFSPKQKDVADVPALLDGALTMIGTEIAPGEKVPAAKGIKAKVGFLAIAIEPGEKVPADQQVTIPGNKQPYRRWKEGDPLEEPGKERETQGTPFLVVAEEIHEFKRLKIGDRIKAGQMVALVDPVLAVRELAIKVAQLKSAKAEVLSTTKTKLEGYRRWQAMESANRRTPGSVSKDDVEGGRLTFERYSQEQVSKEAAVAKAQQELLMAATMLDKHAVRTSNSGVVKVIYKQRGEAVKYLDPVIQVEIDEPKDSAPATGGGRTSTAEKDNLATVPALKSGPLVVIGTEIKPGEKVPAGNRLTAKVGFLVIAIRPGEKVPDEQRFVFPGYKRHYRRWQGGDPLREMDNAERMTENEEPFMFVAEERRAFKRLQVGDEVKAGQIVALIDPILAIKELAIWNAQLNSANAEFPATVKTKQESHRRWQAVESANRSTPGSVSKDDIEGARLTYERYAQDQIVKEAAVAKAEQELLQAVTILDKYTVRTANSGVIKRIYKQLGEGVKYLDPVVQIEIDKNGK